MPMEWPSITGTKKVSTSLKKSEKMEKLAGEEKQRKSQGLVHISQILATTTQSLFAKEKWMRQASTPPPEGQS